MGGGHRIGGEEVVKVLWERADEAQELLVSLTFSFLTDGLWTQLGFPWLLPVLGHLASNNTMVIQVQVMNFRLW